MQREELIALMVERLQDVLAEQGAHETIQASAASPLIGVEAVLTSLGLVSFIVDVESTLGQTYGVELTLVSEQALSRRNSPFRTVHTLADYILELVGAPGESEVAVSR